VELETTVVDESQFHSKERDAGECEHGKFSGRFIFISCPTNGLTLHKMT
jgi:hypothetical protein